MTDTLVQRSALPRTALHRFASRLGLAARARRRQPVSRGVDARGFAQLSDHLLRDIGLVREPGIRLCRFFPNL
jgi:uncharacterized protein YjiS (DUF1127 family)